MARFTDMALAIVDLERRQQQMLKDQGRFMFTPADRGMHEPEKLACIIAEVGEVSEHVLKRVHLHNEKGSMEDSDLITELSQVAALSVAWMELLLEEEVKRDLLEEEVKREEAVISASDPIDDATGQGRR
jgi:hypothetical protein